MMRVWVVWRLDARAMAAVPMCVHATEQDGWACAREEARQYAGYEPDERPTWQVLCYTQQTGG